MSDITKQAEGTPPIPEETVDAQPHAGVPKVNERRRGGRSRWTRAGEERIQMSIRLSRQVDTTVDRMVKYLNSMKPPDAPEWNRTTFIELALLDLYYEEWLPQLEAARRDTCDGGPDPFGYTANN